MFALLQFIALMLTICKYGRSSEANDELKNFVHKYASNNSLVVIYNNEIETDFIFDLPVPKILIENAVGDVVDFFPNLWNQRDNFVLIEKNIGTLNSTIHRMIPKSIWKVEEIVLVIFEGYLSESEIKRAFSLLWKQYIFNVALHYKGGNVYTWHPLHEGARCGKCVLPVKVIDNFTKQQIPTTFRGCKLRTSWHKVSMFLNDPSSDKFPGAFFLLLNDVADRLNIDVEFIQGNSNIFTT